MTATPTTRPIARHAVILCHPAPGSFNHAVAETYCATVRECGQEAVLRDLYAMRFDPVLRAEERPTVAGFVPSRDVVAEQDLIGGCNALVLIYPIWFGTPPAMLKGYVERVLGSGVDPRAVQRHASPRGLLGDARLISFTSSASSDAWLSEQGELQSLRTLFDRYLVHSFAMRDERHVHFPRIVPDLRERFVNENLTVVRQQARGFCGEFLIEHHRVARPVPV